MVILKIRFFLRLRHCCCCLLRTVIIYLFSDFSKLFCKDDIHCHMLHYLCVRSVTSHRFLSSVYIQLIRKKKKYFVLKFYQQDLPMLISQWTPSEIKLTMQFLKDQVLIVRSGISKLHLEVGRNLHSYLRWGQGRALQTLCQMSKFTEFYLPLLLKQAISWTLQVLN